MIDFSILNLLLFGITAIPNFNKVHFKGLQIKATQFLTISKNENRNY
jgi:hypothetical protein